MLRQSKALGSPVPSRMTPRLVALIVSRPALRVGSAEPRVIVAGVANGKTCVLKVIVSAAASALVFVIAPRRLQSLAVRAWHPVTTASEVVSTTYEFGMIPAPAGSDAMEKETVSKAAMNTASALERLCIKIPLPD